MHIIDTMSDPAGRRPEGLYGNAFAQAPAEQVRGATSPLSPPTISNILALAALPGGRGDYSREELLYTLNTAYTGFSAACRESGRMVAGRSRTLVHTGYWGCGAFGGNRVLMTMLQALAGDLAGVDVVFWTLDEPGVEQAREARDGYERLRDSTSSVSNTVDRLLDRGFQWGISDGN